jgi:hypothetical protein
MAVAGTVVSVPSVVVSAFANCPRCVPYEYRWPESYPQGLSSPAARMVLTCRFSETLISYGAEKVTIRSLAASFRLTN